MKQSLLLLFALWLLIGCTNSNKDLFEKTDNFVYSLDKGIESYGLLGTDKYAVTTTDSMYVVTPIGRLINVKIAKPAYDEEYEKLEKVLIEHYKNDNRVNDVYICQAGTVMIDCRN